MTDDVRKLFELADRDMRPEFRERLIALARDDLYGTRIETDVHTDVAVDADLAFVDTIVVPIETKVTGRSNPRRPSAWLGLAAACVVVIALVAVTRDDGRPSQMSTASTVAADPRCAGAEPLGVVATMTGRLRVQLMNNGWSFCVTEDGTGVPVAAGANGPVLAGDEPVPVQHAAVIESGMLTATSAYYVIAVPDTMPAASVQAPNASAKSFPSRVGRRILVIDTDFDPDATPSHETHQLNIMSASRVLLATLTADISS